ncbi:MAG: bifunctional diaminohydroxyphosphoribosylaminopyrimidine deaminase/5-amino-6-(5-phosphoribosylamino)uracil reductase RibD [Synechococcus sp.]
MWTRWMRRALALAALADGATSPNPLVGAVVLDANGQLVGEGFHARAGDPHAEVGALIQAGDAARGGTLVVTLEPCCHYGRTPPCSDAVIQAGIVRVVIALEDPDPRVAGGGISQLRAAGLEVISGVLRELAAEQNRAFLHRVQTGRPWGVLKWAMSLDGRTALPNGASQWISGPTARHWVHQLRGQVDAVIVGGGTVRADDPLLTSRGQRSPEPLRVVLSRSLDLPDQAQLWDTSVAPTVLAHGANADPQRLPSGPETLDLGLCEPLQLMEALAERGCNRVLWECGPALAAAAIRQGCVQEVAAVVAPKLMGGDPARTPLGDLGITAMDQVLTHQDSGVQSLGTDWLLRLTLDGSSDDQARAS